MPNLMVWSCMRLIVKLLHMLYTFSASARSAAAVAVASFKIVYQQYYTLTAAYSQVSLQPI